MAERHVRVAVIGVQVPDVVRRPLRDGRPLDGRDLRLVGRLRLGALVAVGAEAGEGEASLHEAVLHKGRDVGFGASHVRGGVKVTKGYVIRPELRLRPPGWRQLLAGEAASRGARTAEARTGLDDRLAPVKSSNDPSGCSSA